MQRDISPAQSFPPVSSTLVRTLHPLREYIHEQLEPCTFDVCRRVTPRSRLNQCLGKISSGSTGARSSSGARLNVPNVNYPSGDPARRYRPPSEKSSRSNLADLHLVFVSCIFYYREIIKSMSFSLHVARSCIASSHSCPPKLILPTFLTQPRLKFQLAANIQSSFLE